jgi:uncharacterized membrane protein
MTLPNQQGDRKIAKWRQRTVLIYVISTFLVLILLIVSFVAIRQSRHVTTEAQHALESANQQITTANAIAVAGRQLPAAVAYNRVNFATTSYRQDGQIVSTATPIWKNNGTTETHNLTLLTAYGLLHGFPLIIQSGDLSHKTLPVSIAVVAPGAEVQGSLITLPVSILDGIRKNNLVLLIAGIANYKDASGGNHITQSCMAFGGAPIGTGADSGNGQRGLTTLGACPDYNCVDEACSQAKQLQLDATESLKPTTGQ